MIQAAVFPVIAPRHSLVESLRIALVYGCALALIGAGPFLPGVAW